VLAELEGHPSIVRTACMAVNPSGHLPSMKLYADSPLRRARQLAGDLLLALWVVIWLWLARVVHDATLALAAPGRTIEDAGSGLAERLRDAGGAVSELPLVGDQARSPFDGAGRAADQIAAAGTAQVQAVEHLATGLAVAVGAIPVLLALAVHLTLRWRFVRAASAAQRLLDAASDLDLFALRALSNQPLHRLVTVSPDPAAGWRRGDPLVVRRLAELELQTAGLTPPRQRR
jgi:hypothetical protein